MRESCDWHLKWKGQFCGVSPSPVWCKTVSRRQSQDWAKLKDTELASLRITCCGGETPHVWWPAVSEIKCCVTQTEDTGFLGRKEELGFSPTQKEKITWLFLIQSNIGPVLYTNYTFRESFPFPHTNSPILCLFLDLQHWNSRNSGQLIFTKFKSC